MLETTIENRLKKEVEKRGGKVWKFTSPGTRGVPDRIVLLKGGKTIFVELKAPGEVRKPLQVKRALELHELDFPVYCLDSYAAVQRFVWGVFGK